MFIARVVGNLVSTVKHSAYDGKKILILEMLDLEGNPTGDYEIGVDYVGAGEGDLVMAGGAPGVAQKVFNIEKAPIQILIMAIVDKYSVGDKEYSAVRGSQDGA